MNFSYIIRMVWREIRSSWRRFGFFIFCISLGVAGIVTVGAISNQVERSMMREAKGLLGGDIEIEMSHPISVPGYNYIKGLEKKGIRETLVYELIAMAGKPGSKESQLVELKAVRPEYPLYGDLILEPAGDFSSFSSPGRAWVENSFLAKLGLKTGDKLRLGQSELVIEGVIQKEPDRMTEAFSMGPRILISESSLNESGLVQPGSRVRYRYLLQLPRTLSPVPVLKDLKETLADDKATVETYREAQPRLRRFLNNLTIYLGLMGVVALFIGGIGVGNSIHAYLKEKSETMGILKCLGTTSRVLFAIYLIQSLIMGLAGALLGIFIGLIIHILFQGTLRGMIPQAGSYIFPFIPIVQGILAGIGVILLFSIIPLYRMTDLSPSLILRDKILPPTRAIKGVRRWITVVLIVLGAIVFVFWVAEDIRRGALFLGVFLASAIVLRLAVLLLFKGIKYFHPASFAIRYGLANLKRPGQFAQSVILSIGLGTTVVTAILFIRAGMIQQVTSNIPDRAPSFFFIDIQNNQVVPFEELVDAKYRKWGFPAGHDLNPILRGRLSAVNSSPLAQLKSNQQWYYQREYVLTFQEKAPEENRIIQGLWWGEEEGREKNLISIEEDLARHLGVGIGSTLTFDLQGSPVEGVITNIRQVNWENLRTNFFVIYTPHAFKGKGVTYIATSRAPLNQELVFQGEVVTLFPNVTVINVRHILDTLKDIMGKILLAVQFMGGFTVGAGLVVLAGSMAATRYFRLKEAVVLKILGATRRRISEMFIAEYTLLGLIAGSIGVVMGSILAIVFLKYILEIEWKMPLVVFPAVVAVTVFVTIVISYWITGRVTQRKPLELLREN